MNANELADYWMNRKFAIEMADETADMLRQLQAEIEALKAKYETPRTPSPRLSHSEIGKLLGKKGY